MTVATLVGLVLGAIFAWLAWRGCRDWLAGNPQLQRTNYAGRPVPVAGGLVLVVAVLGTAALWVIGGVVGGPAGGGASDVTAIGGGSELWRAGAVSRATGETLGWRAVLDLLALVAVPVVALVAGFGLLGFVDDVLGGGMGAGQPEGEGRGHGSTDKGFRGHLRALSRGRVTTGILKLVGGTAVALVVAGWGADDLGIVGAGATGSAGSDAWRLVVDAAAIALAANLANLFDLAPGRLLKAGLVCGAGLLAWGWGGLAAPVVAPVLGASAALLPPDLGERTMLGDTGANVLGAVLAFVFLRTLGDTGATVFLVVLVALNAVSEVVSYSKVIRSVPPLRWADGLGRRSA